MAGKLSAAVKLSKKESITFKALRVEIYTLNLELSFTMKFLTLGPTFKNFGTAAQLSPAVKLSEKLKIKVKNQLRLNQLN